MELTSNPAAELRCSAIHPEAFVGFYDIYFDELLGYLTRRTCDVEAGLDLTAETFAQAYLSRRGFRGETDHEAGAWLYRIAKRQLARYFKKGQAERQALDRLELERPVLDPETHQQIARLAALGSLRAALRDELVELSPSHREAVRLRVVEELPYRDVASELGISESTARARVSRSLKRLANVMDRNLLTEGDN